jgi:AraC-like DNA-binding protein
MARQLRVGQSGLDPFGQLLQPTLRKALANAVTDIDSIAGLMGLSTRTLQRRLSDAGQSFGKLLEDFRFAEAKRLLSEPALAIEEVSARLGYAEQSSFNRAFKKWSGTTPKGWRRGGTKEGAAPEGGRDVY